MFVPLGIQHVMRVRHLSSVDRRALRVFSALSHKSYDFRKKKKRYSAQNVCCDDPYNF